MTWRDLVIANLSPFVPYYGMQTGLLCLLLGDIVENPVMVMQSPYEDLFSQSQRIPYMVGLDMKDRRFIPSCECWHPPQPTLDSYACGLPLTHLTFELQLP